MRKIQLLVLLSLLATPVYAADTREAAQRTPEEKEFVLDQMRLFLTSLQAINADLADGRMTEAAAEAAARGRKASAQLAKPASISAKESDTWKTLMGNVRVGFDNIASSAAAGQPVPRVLGEVGATMQNCVACHRTYRIVETE